MQTRNKTLVTVAIIFALVLLVGLFLLGIVQTFIINNQNSQLSALQKQNAQVVQDSENAEKELDYLNSDEHADDYFISEKGYGKDGDKIIKS